MTVVVRVRRIPRVSLAHAWYPVALVLNGVRGSRFPTRAHGAQGPHARLGRTVRYAERNASRSQARFPEPSMNASTLSWATES